MGKKVQAWTDWIKEYYLLVIALVSLINLIAQIFNWLIDSPTEEIESSFLMVSQWVGTLIILGLVIAGITWYTKKVKQGNEIALFIYTLRPWAITLFYGLGCITIFVSTPQLVELMNKGYNLMVEYPFSWGHELMTNFEFYKIDQSKYQAFINSGFMRSLTLYSLFYLMMTSIHRMNKEDYKERIEKTKSYRKTKTTSII